MITFAGRLTDSFETRTLEPCGSNEVWDVEFANREVAEDVTSAMVRRELAPAWPEERINLRGRGVLKGPGRYGHLNAFRWQLVIVEVLELDTQNLYTRPASCPSGWRR